MTITDKVDFKAKVRASMCQLQNDPEKIRTKNYRSNMPPDSAFTYGLINRLADLVLLDPIRWRPCADPGQKREPATGRCKKGIDTPRPVTEERIPIRLRRNSL